MSRLAILLIALAAVGASAQTLYRYVDKDGKVTYTDVPPGKRADKDGQKVEEASSREIKVDPNVNRMDGVKPEVLQAMKDRESKVAKTENEKEAVAADNAETAKGKLTAAKKALADGKDPKDDEWMTVGNGRRVPSEAFSSRIKKLEDDVKDAEKALANAEGKPSAPAAPR